jgi:hypothetical protein
MNSNDFTNLYTKKDSDETLVSFQNEAGFSLVRPYPGNTPYAKEGLKMFIKVAVLDRGLFYGVDMTRSEKRDEEDYHVIVDGSKYKHKVTSFRSDVESNEFSFDESKKKVIHSKTQKEFTINQFVEILVKNHISDRLFWKRKLNKSINILLRILFWLSDKHYDLVRVSINRHEFSRDNRVESEEEKNIEPFFKYFYISKNFIFAVLLASFTIAILSALFPCKIPLKAIWLSQFGEFSLSNPMVVLLFFLGLFSSEKLSMWLNKKIRLFIMPSNEYFDTKKENFIEKLHNYQQHNKFDLKL